MVDIYKLKFTVLQQEILKFLIINAGASFNAHHLAKQLDVSQTAVSKAVPQLEEREFIKTKKDRDSGRWSIELNRDNPVVISLKRVENLKLTYESGLADYLFESLPGTTIILFGSYSRGDDTFKSDIDVAVIGSKEKELNLNKFEKMLIRKIVLNFYPSLKDMHKSFRENLCNGIVLAGGIEL